MNVSAPLDSDTGEESDTASDSGLVVAVDGPSGAGKSSASRGAATELGLRYLDTGSMYRALTWWLLGRGVDVGDAGTVGALAAEPQIEVGTDPRKPWVRIEHSPGLPVGVAELSVRPAEADTLLDALEAGGWPVRR